MLHYSNERWKLGPDMDTKHRTRKAEIVKIFLYLIQPLKQIQLNQYARKNSFSSLECVL